MDLNVNTKTIQKAPKDFPHERMIRSQLEMTQPNYDLVKKLFPERSVAVQFEPALPLSGKFKSLLHEQMTAIKKLFPERSAAGQIEPYPALPSPGEIKRYPVLTLRDIVVFPYMIVPFFAGREKSINALDEVMRTDGQILLATQKNAGDDDPEPSAIYTMGTLATVLELSKLPDGTVKVLVEGTARVKVERFSPNELFFEAEVERVDETIGNQDEIEAFARLAVSQFESYVKLNKKISPEVLSTLSQIDDYSKLADTIASHLAINISKKQKILELLSVSERLERVFTLMENEISVLQVERKIRSHVRSRIKKTQRKYLNEQMKAIQKALVKASDERESFFLHEQMTAVQKELEDFDKGKSRRRVKR
jgi:ATP-dependent Lon protease